MLRVTADTNILVSGLVYRRGKPYDLLRMALDGTINLTVSQHILDEMADVLARKFSATPKKSQRRRRSFVMPHASSRPPCSWTSLSRIRRTTEFWSAP